MENEHFPEEALLKSAESGNMESLMQLDEAGFLMCPGETPAAFAARIRSMRQYAVEIIRRTKEKDGFEFYPGIVLTEQRRIPEYIMQEAAAINMEHYGFSINWVPGYFIGSGLGPLWGGCAVTEERPDAVPVFIIRRNFRTAEKWFLYRRSELLSHELCHAARAPLRDSDMEELFAYAVSSSILRRKIGNCFQQDRDAVLFLLPVFLLLAVQIMICIFDFSSLPAWPFWILIFLWPSWLLLRNHLQRRFYFRAERKMKKAGFIKPAAALFRCTTDEIRAFSEMTQEQISARFRNSENDVRMKLVFQRFGPRNY